jgi:hypothetical protein
VRLLILLDVVFCHTFWSFGSFAVRGGQIAGTDILAVSAGVEVRVCLFFAPTLYDYLLAAREVSLSMRKLFFNRNKMRSSLQLLNQVDLIYLLLNQCGLSAANFYGSGFNKQIGTRTVAVEVRELHLAAFRLFAPKFLGCLKKAFVFLLQTRVVVGESFPKVSEMLAFKLIPFLHASFA